MQIYLGADHRGFELKNKLRDWLKAEGHQVTDLGAQEYEANDDYPDYAFSVGEAVAKTPNTRGIVVCGSGTGADVAANKVRGVRASLIHDPALAKFAQEHDNINVLALGSDFIDEARAKAVVEAWLASAYSGEERHTRRIKKIEEYEQK